MPELKNNFVRGKMNKDLDERLIPNGQYRDAANIQVSTSLGSDVGAVESLRGNQGQRLNTLDTLGNDWVQEFGFASDGPRTIGTYADTQNNKIYWFVATETRNKSAIFEYDEASNSIVPVITDLRNQPNQVLNFRIGRKITGINVIEGLLFWTDDFNSPRRLNIERFKNACAGIDESSDIGINRVSTIGSNVIDNTTHIYQHGSLTPRLFTEEDISVIKKAPNAALTVTNFATNLYSGGPNLGTVLEPAPTTGNFSNGNFGPLATGTSINITLLGTSSVDNFVTAVGASPKGTVLLTAREKNADGSLITYEVRATVNAQVGTTREFELIMISGSVNMPNAILDWEAVLEEGDPIFKDDFARFTYRYKFFDGEYSPYAPFSKAAFVAGIFSYSQTSAFNKGMDNQVRRVDLKNFQALPPDAKAIELLYKASNSNNIYEIKTFERGSVPVAYPITKTPSGPVIESNQLIRPYDNVPRLAKAQEIIGNRIVYGNYLQNYNVTTQGVDNAKITASQSNDTGSLTNLGQASVKSDRDYQIGVTWIDEFGRETPVFVSQDSSVKVEKENCDKVNTLKATLGLNFFGTGVHFPSFATHYKFYVKDQATTYHNLAMDRFYFAEDGNVWISFPSSERNKVKEGDYLILKKEHDSNTAILRNNRFKVLSLENEAPDFIKTRRHRVASAICYATQDDSSSTLANSGAPNNSALPHLLYKSFTIGKNIVKFRGPTLIDKRDFHNAFGDDLEIQFFSEDFSQSSAIYGVRAGGPTGETDLTGTAQGSRGITPSHNEFSIELDKGLLDTDSFFTTLGANKFEKFHVRIYKDVIRPLPEFSGRFFIKIEQNTTTRNHIISKVANLTLNTVSLGTIDTSTGYTNTASRAAAAVASGGFINDIMPKKVGFPAGKNIAEQKVLGQQSNSLANLGYDKVHAGFKDEFAIDEDPHNPFGASNNKDFSIPGEIYSAPGGTVSQNGFSIGFVAGFAGDFKNMGDYGVGDNYPDKTVNGTGNSYTNAELKNNATLTSEQLKLHGLFDNLKIGKQLRFVNASGQASQPFTITQSNEFYYYRDSSRNSATGFGNFSSVARKIDITVDKNFGDIGKIHSIEIYEDRFDNSEGVLSTDNPAIFETEPIERADLELFYEASDAIAVNTIAGQTAQPLNLFTNCFSFNNGVESDKIRDDFNAATVGKGIRVSSILKEPYMTERRGAGLIYGGIFNSTSGVNETNQFIAGLKITKDLNPIYGTIQKLHTRGGGARGDLLCLMEDKCFRILANKDALFNADGNPQLVSTNNVLGQVTPFAGEYGISKNPESFAYYGFRSYFTDKARGVVIRLSADGITVISDKGMTDFFSDLMEKEYDITTDTAGGLVGSYDITTDTYNVAFGSESYSFKEESDGWTTRLTYAPEAAVSLNNMYYSYRNGEIYSHNNDTRGVFFGNASASTVDVVLNANPSSIKNFKTVYYEGDAGWLCEVETENGTGFVKTADKGKWGEQQAGLLTATSEATDKEGIFYGWIRGDKLDIQNRGNVQKFLRNFSVIGLGPLLNLQAVAGVPGGFYEFFFDEPVNISLSDGDEIYTGAGTAINELRGVVQNYNTPRTTAISADRKTVIVKLQRPVIPPNVGEYLFALKDNEINTSGLLGYHAILKFSTALKVSGEKNELFAVGSEIFISS